MPRVYDPEYYKRNKEAILKKRKDHYTKNHAAVRERQDRYREGPKYAALKGRYVTYQRNYRRNRYATNSQWKLAVNCRGRIRTALKAAKMKKGNRTISLLGCTFAELEAHLGDGPGEIDHIWPICMYDLTNPAQQRMAFNYRNLQRVSAEYNRRKWTREPSDEEKAKVPIELWPPGRRPQRSSPGSPSLARPRVTPVWL